jgi:hypothetical protein
MHTSKASSAAKGFIRLDNSHVTALSRRRHNVTYLVAGGEGANCSA